MNIAFTAQGPDMDSPIDPRFGRTRFFLILDDETGDLKSVDNGAADADAHGVGPKSAQKLMGLQAQVLITGNGPGGNAAAVLETTGIEVYVGAGEMTVKEALEAYRNGELKKSGGA